MSQSAMSNALTRLRDYFDDPLLVQVGRRMEVTPRAEAMRPAIRDILVRIESTIDAHPEFHPEQSTRAFNILLSDYSMRVLMPSVFQRIAEQNATIKINLHAQTDLPQVLLERGEIDLLISPEIFMSNEHPSSLLYEDKYVVAAWKGGKYGDVDMDRATFEAATHAVMVPPGTVRSVETSLLSQAGISRNIDVQTFSFSVLPHLIAGTDRIATIHGRLARLVAPQAELVTYPMPTDLPPLRQMVQWHAYRDNDPGINWLRSTIEEAAAKMV